MLVLKTSDSFTVLINGVADEQERMTNILTRRPDVKATVSLSEAEIIYDQSTARCKNEFLNMLNAPPKEKAGDKKEK